MTTNTLVILILHISTTLNYLKNNIGHWFQYTNHFDAFRQYFSNEFPTEGHNIILLWKLSNLLSNCSVLQTLVHTLAFSSIQWFPRYFSSSHVNNHYHSSSTNYSIHSSARLLSWCPFKLFQIAHGSTQLSVPAVLLLSKHCHAVLQVD